MVVNGNGASWIKEATKYFKDAVYQLDRFHLRRALLKSLPRDEKTQQVVIAGILRNDWEMVQKALDKAIKKRQQQKAKKRIYALRHYLVANWDGITDYRDRDLNVPEGARGLGTVESQVDKVIARRFKKHGMSWTYKGADHLCKLIIMRENKTLKIWASNPVSVANPVAQKTVTKMQHTLSEAGSWLQAHMPALEGPHAGRQWVKTLRSLIETKPLSA